MTGRRFSAPDWGQDHLSLDAVVAYVDDELAAGAHHRADTHLACCPDCRAEVVAQRQARSALRTAAGPRLPSSLLHTLRAIPVEAELPPPPPGLGITADGQFVLLRDVPPVPGDEQPVPARRTSRRARFGAVSGLAIGALAVGALATPGPATTGSGALGGTVLSGQVRSSAVLGSTTRSRSGAASTSATAAVGPARRPDAETGSAATTSDPAAADAVLDPRVRQQLDRAPVAFHRSP